MILYVGFMVFTVFVLIFLFIFIILDNKNTQKNAVAAPRCLILARKDGSWFFGA